MSEPDIEKKKKKPGKRRRSARVYINANRPLAVPLDEIAAHFPSDDDDQAADVPESSEKAIAPAGNPHVFPGGRNPVDRTSASLTEGHQAVSSGHHVDPMNVPGPSEMAFRHPDMRNGTTSAFPLGAARTDADAFPRDLRGMTNGVPVALSRLDAAAAAGMPGPPANPFARPGDHIARDSATPRNGSHGPADAVSHGGPALKASDAREIMRRHMFPGSGAR